MRTKQQLTFTKLEDEIDEILGRMFGLKGCMIEVDPGKVILPADYEKIGQEIMDMAVHEDDVWICSHPRTGYIQDARVKKELRQLMDNYKTCQDNEALIELKMLRCPQVELSCIWQKAHREWHNEFIESTSVDLVKHRLPHPRYVRSHLPWDLLPLDIKREDGSVKAKVIYITRNPKDMVVSYFNYCKLVHHLNGNFDEFCELFMEGRTPFAPVWSHIFAFWNRRHDQNVMFIKYEDLKRDLPSVVRKTAKFLDKDLTEEQVRKLCDYLSFNNMQNNRAVNWEPVLEQTYGKSYLEETDLKFVRKGEIGDWKNFMSDDLSKRFDEWVQKNLAGSELSFD